MFEHAPAFELAAAEPDRRRGRRQAFRRERRPDERVTLLGEAVDLVRPEEVLHLVETRVVERRKTLIANHNLNSLYLIRREPAMRRFYELADLIEVDSRPLIAFARLLGLRSRAFHRCTYLDWRDHFWSLADRHGWRVMYIGGEANTVGTAAERLNARYPGAAIQAHHGFFDVDPSSAASLDVLAEAKAFDPHILFVGMGMPRQELWIADNFQALPDSVIFSVGAAFDYEAGTQAAAPRWMGRVGLEWLFRLAHDPRRLWRRYLVESWRLTAPALRDIRSALARGLRSSLAR